MCVWSWFALLCWWHCCGSTLVQAVESLQKAFAVQLSLFQLKHVLNANKSELMMFSQRQEETTFDSLCVLAVFEMEWVHVYKSLCIMIDDCLNFEPHVEKLVKQLRLKWGFILLELFVSLVTKQLVAATFLPVLRLWRSSVYESVCSMFVNDWHRLLCSLRIVRHWHVTVSYTPGSTGLLTRRLSHRYTFIYKGIFLPSLFVLWLTKRYNYLLHLLIFLLLILMFLSLTF